MKLGRPRSLPDAIRGRILELRAAGETYAAIADWLNESNIPTAHGGSSWHPSTVRRVVQSGT